METAYYRVIIIWEKRFRELERGIPKISPRMLSKELKDLEANGIVKRTVYDSIPVIVEYELTISGESLNQVLEPMIEWGLQHRKMLLGNERFIVYFWFVGNNYC